MNTRVVLIAAGPTPWDVEGRIVGSLSLPLTAEAMDAIGHLLDTLPAPVDSVYCASVNEACQQAAQLVARKFSLRVRNNPDLNGVKLGLWEGLTPETLHQRFPTVFQQWHERPLSVSPPDGETLEEAIERIGGALVRILRRNRGSTVALSMRPAAMQIAAGVLRLQSALEIAAHIRERVPMESIELDGDALKKILG